MKKVLVCLMFMSACQGPPMLQQPAPGQVGPIKATPQSADTKTGPIPPVIVESVKEAALDLSYCPVNEAIRDCQTGGASGTEAGWDWDRPGPNELQIAGYGPQGWRCKIIYCDIPQYNNSFNAGAIGELSRFGLGYGIRYMRNGLGTYSRSYPERCWSGGIAHESNGMQQMIWWTERFKSLDCWPNRANVNPYQWY